MLKPSFINDGPSMNKVFGIGWAKTGTTTLGKCLKILGYNHQSQDLKLVDDIAKKDLSRIFAVAQFKDSFEDWPWLILYRELDLRFPGSRFILTRRNSNDWISSYKNMLLKQGEASGELNTIRRTLYGLPFPEVTSEQLIERYERHNQDVLNYFKSRPGDLIILDWTTGDAWPELCRFLNKPVPKLPFPHMNKGKY